MKPDVRALPLALASLSLAAACGGGVSGGEVVYVEPAPSALPELEPNDDAWSAMPIGSFRVGDFLAIEGHVTECCPDPLDGFALYVEEPLELRVALFALGPADLDLCFYDPFEERFLACFETPYDPELGSLAVGGPGELHLVVSAWAGDAPYRLEIEAWPLGSYPASAAPAGAPVVSERFADYEKPAAVRELERSLEALFGLDSGAL